MIKLHIHHDYPFWIQIKFNQTIKQSKGLLTTEKSLNSSFKLVLNVIDISNKKVNKFSIVGHSKESMDSEDINDIRPFYTLLSDLRMSEDILDYIFDSMKNIKTEIEIYQSKISLSVYGAYDGGVLTPPLTI